jgi:hypothetical protein
VTETLGFRWSLTDGDTRVPAYGGGAPPHGGGRNRGRSRHRGMVGEHASSRASSECARSGQEQRSSAPEMVGGSGGGRQKFGQPFGVVCKPAKDLEKFRGDRGIYRPRLTMAGGLG